MIGVNIAGALARLAVIAVYLGITIVAGGASLATGAVVSGHTITANLIALLIHLAAGGKVIGGGRQRACTDQTIRRCAHSGVTIVTLFAELAMIANSAILAILEKESHRTVTDKKFFKEFYPRKVFTIHLTDPGVYIACSRMAVALTRRAISSVWS